MARSRKKAVLIGGTVEFALGAAVLVIGGLSGWSNGAIGSALMGAIAIGTFVLVVLSPRSPESRG